MPKKEIEAAEKVLDAILRDGFRDHEGVLSQPYRGWVDRLNADLEKWRKWNKGGKK